MINNVKDFIKNEDLRVSYKVIILVKLDETEAPVLRCSMKWLFLENS